ncbi:hypothetical protein [Pedococcus soli]
MEDLVSHEIGKALKEVGYNHPTEHVWIRAKGRLNKNEWRLEHWPCNVPADEEVPAPDLVELAAAYVVRYRENER